MSSIDRSALDVCGWPVDVGITVNGGWLDSLVAMLVELIGNVADSVAFEILPEFA